MSNKIIKFLRRVNLRSIFFNFKYLPVRQAIKLPFLVSNKVYLLTLKGKVIIDCPIEPGMIKIGYGGVGIFDKKKSRSIWEVSGTIIFMGKCNIGHGSKISVGENGKLVLGERFSISAETSIVAFSEITFGNDCLLSWDTLIMDTDFHKINDEKGNVINNPKPIIFGNHVWIGCRCLILKGSYIPDNCVIGANSFVNRRLEKENCIYAGNPCRIAKENISWGNE